MRLTQTELVVILEKHLKWLRGEAEGRRADLTDADLTDAVLTDADLTGADLRGADLTDADLTGADLRGADLRGADLELRERTPEEYAQIAADYRARHPEVPVVPNLDKQICEIVNSGQGRLKMSDWHTCETSHCRAGWAIHLAGAAGYELEAKHSPEIAGGRIYRASTGRWPDFFVSDTAALEDICKWGNIDSGNAENTTATE